MLLDLTWKNIQRWKWRLCGIALLIALAFALYIVYAGSLEATVTSSVGSISLLDLPYDLKVKLPPGERVLSSVDWVPSGYPNTLANLRVHRYYEFATEVRVRGPKGFFDILGLQSDSRYYNLDQIELEGRLCSAAEEMVLPAALAEELGLRPGDKLSVYAWANSPTQSSFRSLTFKIVGIYHGLGEGFSLEPALVLSSDAETLAESGEPNCLLLNADIGATAQNSSVYNEAMINRLHNQMLRTFPMATVVGRNTPQFLGRALQEQATQSGGGLLILITLFVCIGVTTIAIMTFLERRKEMAALKTVGISNRQIVEMMILEYSLAALIGVVLGLSLLGILLFLFEWLRALPTMTLLRLVGIALLNTLAALVLALIYPLATARVATVNQLLYARRIPLGSRQIGHMLNPRSGYVYKERQENVRILKLTPWREAPGTLLLKKVGDSTKRGEVIVTKEESMGFFLLEWVAPCDGTVVEIDESGMIAISPSDPDTPFYPYPAHMIEMERRSEENVKRAIGEARELKVLPRNARSIGMDMERRRTRYAQQDWSEWVSFFKPASDERTSITASAAYDAPKEIVSLPVIPQNITRLKPLWLFLVVVLCYGYLYVQSTNVRTTYYLSQAVLVDLQDTLIYNTSLTFLEQEQVRNSLAGRIVSVLVEDGSFVSAGQPLLTLANPSQQEALLPARQNLNLARQAYDTQLLLSMAENSDLSASQLALLQQRALTDQLRQSAGQLALRAPASGRIVSVETAVGESLRSGDALFGFYNADLVKEGDREVRLLRAAANLEAARKAADQLQLRAPFPAIVSSSAVLPGYSLSSGDLLLTLRREEPYPESLAIQIQRLEQQLAQAAERVDSLVIRASLAGTITGLKVNEGDYLSAGSSLGIITGAAETWLRVMVPQNQMSGISIGNTAEIVLTHNNRYLQGTVQAIAEGQRDPQSFSVAFPVEINLTYSSEPLNGMTATVTVSRNDPTEKTLPLRGTIEQRGTAVRSEVAGEVAEILARNGDLVSSGEIIAVLLNPELQLSYDRLAEQLESLLTLEFRAPLASAVGELLVSPGERVSPDQLLMRLTNGVLAANLQKAEEDYRLLATEMISSEMIRAPLSGTVSNLLVAEGEQVVAGQILALLSNPDLEYQLAVAESTLLKREAEAAAALLNPGASDLARSALVLQQAEDRLRQLEAGLDALTVSAPVAGIINFRQHLIAGIDLPGNQLLATINGLSLGLRFYVEEISQQHLQLGLPVAVEVLSYPEDLFWGEISAIDLNGTVSADGRVSFGATVLLEPDERLLSGMTATAYLILREVKDIIAIPLTCLKQQIINDELVYAVDRVSAGGKLVEVPVEVGMITRYAVEVTEGLREGDMVAALLGVQEPNIESEFQRFLENFRSFVFWVAGVRR